MNNYDDYKVVLNNGQIYLFDTKLHTYFDIPSCKTTYTKRIFYVKTVREVMNEDWKTAIAHNQKSIPAGTILKVDNILTNLYGRFIETMYNGNLYYIKPIDIEYIESKLIEVDSIKEIARILDE